MWLQKFLFSLFVSSSLFIYDAESYSPDRYKGRVFRVDNRRQEEPSARRVPAPLIRKTRGKCHDEKCMETEIRMKRIEATCEFGICEESPEYPLEAIENVVKANANIHSFFGKVIEPYGSPSLSSKGAGKGNPLCESSIEVKYPVEMIDTYGKPRYIANIHYNEEYRQAVLFEVCRHPSKSCFIGKELLDHKTECVQKFTATKLLVLSDNSTYVEYASFAVPSTCVCMVQGSWGGLYSDP